MIDIEELLEPAADTPPCGQDLTYDAEFLALETAATGKPEQQFGEMVIPAEPPDWRDVERRARALLVRTKDARVAALLCRALTNIQGVRGMSQGVQLMAGMFARYWDDLHPLPEDGDYFMRMNAVSSLNEITGLLRDLRQQDFVRLPGGAISVRDAEAVARGTAAEGGARISLDQLRVALAQAWQQGDESLRAWSTASEALRSLQTTFRDRLESSQVPDLEQFQSLLVVLNDLVPHAPIGVADAATGAPEEGADPGAIAVAAGASAAGAAGEPAGVAGRPAGLRTRDDALAQLLLVAEFLERTEPTNPAPLLIRRAAKLMGLSFLDILRELSPDSVGQVETITGGQNPSS
ncbi:type VI secretion system protein TssA [Paracidovorax avenae]|uniref:type VI secretion system protein TssA n=1 Tax=Paracidovorax avenae TaxID=80867 RepID=UPI000D174E55|nr:type VI secretion system protein TssA [Paracidovorax avenae]AVS77528.1 type VI secretion system protein TssA [Paracidovorax avenae]AVS80748.1 type VI secretion system protein TssA [Paracidovorax avenae]AVS91649.1 type VI secretion system protein TssA [Paracidovorax avenae]AVS98601.1 type VI secretion system protein TssA [Paracidovorax avenae]AVT05641.1 type VI secretion system protein TssA [Paracidovorax avenae]